MGFESGAQFFRSLARQSNREIVVAAGIAVDGWTQSAVIGAAILTVDKPWLAAEGTQRLQANLAIGYALTCILGSFGAVMVYVTTPLWLMRRLIPDDAF